MENIGKQCPLTVQVSVASHIGQVRPENQDDFFVDGRFVHDHTLNDGTNFLAPLSGTQVYAVFDGLGGEKDGGKCSEVAAQVMAEFRDQIIAASPEALGELMNAYASAANNAICAALHCDFSPKGGTTFVAVVLKDGIAYPFYLGDSRIYLASFDHFMLLTEDHTVAQQMIKDGRMTKAQAEVSAENHQLTCFLGADNFRQGLRAQACAPIELAAGMHFLLCSDGLHDMCSAQEMYLLLMHNQEDPAAALIDAALKNGGYDNVTALVIGIEDQKEQA